MKARIIKLERKIETPDSEEYHLEITLKSGHFKDWSLYKISKTYELTEVEEK